MGTPQTPYAPKMGTLVNLNRVVVPAKAQASLSVAVRVRPILKAEQTGNNKRDIIRVIDGKIVVVLDPDEIKDYLDQVQNRTKEKKYTFDVAFDTQARNRDVYAGSIQELAAGVSKGLNGTVFAYGATGSGKTHTMVGTPADPGLMVLSLEHIFKEKAANADAGEDFTVTCSYLEVYNELIYDLLVKNSGPLELREDPDQGVCVAGLKHITVTSAAEIMGLLEEGNRRRKTDSTDANAASSRSHAVLEIIVRRCAKLQYRSNVLIGKLTLVDLAGSERAAETNNAGQKLRDGANINKSLLALANCINALGKQQKTGVAYVPYRNSKLTRLLKDSLRGNSRTAMVATISAAADQYHHSVNTLKYADRAKEIKTHVVQNVGTVERHITDYQNIIDNLQNEVQSLKARLGSNAPGALASSVDELIAAAAAANGGSGHSNSNSGKAGSNSTAAAASGAVPAGGAVSSAEADTLAWIDALAQEINDNVEERINLQKALFELEDVNVCNKYELQNIDDMLKAADSSQNPEEAAEAAERRMVLLEEIQANNVEAEQCRADIAANEACRRDIQAKIEKAIDTNSNVNFLKILSTFRIQAVRLQELKFQMAVRDQIISEQRDVISNLWQILGASGLTRQEVVDIARAEGIVLQGIEHDDLSSPGSNSPHTVGSSSRLSVLGSLPLTSTAGALSGAVNTHSSVSSSPSKQVVPAPAAVPGMQQSLMGGKARYRYKFWQQYKGLETQSTCGQGSPIQALRAPLLQKNPLAHRHMRHEAVSSRVSGAPFPALDAHHSPDRSRSPAYGRQQQQQHRKQPAAAGDVSAPSDASSNKAVSRFSGMHPAVPAAQQDAAAGGSSPAAGARAGRLHHPQQAQQQHLGSAAAVNGSRQHSFSSMGQQQLQQRGKPSVTGSSSSSVGELQHPLGAAAAPGRRHQKSSRQRGRSSAAAPPPAAHPGLPGRQQQLESAIQALHKLKQQAANKPHGAAQQQQQHLIHHHSGMLAWQEPGVSAAAAQQLKQQQKEQQLSAVYGGSPLGDKLARLKKHSHLHKYPSAGVSAEPSYADLTPEMSSASACSTPAAQHGGGSQLLSHQQHLHQLQQQRAGSTNLPSINEGSRPVDALKRRTTMQQLQAFWEHRMSHQ